MPSSPFRDFLEHAELHLEGGAWWALSERADATAEEVAALLEFFEPRFGLGLWPPIFDPWLKVPGLRERLPHCSAAVRKLLSHGLFCAGQLGVDELPKVVCERLCAAYLEREPDVWLALELEQERGRFGDQRFEGGLRAAALRSPEQLVPELVAVASLGANDREVVLLALRTSDDPLDLEREPLRATGPLQSPSAAQLDLIVGLLNQWLKQSPSDVTPSMVFRACCVLLEHGRLAPEHDALLPSEMFAWRDDLAYVEDCGLCVGAQQEAALEHEPSLAVAYLLWRLPRERRERLIEKAENCADQRAVGALFRGWLLASREASEPASVLRAAAQALPPFAAQLLELAWARVQFAPDGRLPRRLQQELLDSLELSRASNVVRAPTPAELSAALGHRRDRVLRLVELHAPISVLLRDANRLRTLERLAQALPSAARETERVTESEPAAGSAWAPPRSEVALLRLVLRELFSEDAELARMVAELARIERGERTIEGELAQRLEQSWEAGARDARAAVVHFAFCARDYAADEQLRSEQDDLFDVAERAFSAVFLHRAGPEAHGQQLIEARRGWWLRWLTELLPAAVKG